MNSITAKVNTKLKKLPVESSHLNPEQMIDVPAGKSYGYESFEPSENGHIKVTLAAHSGTFYVFATHWEGLVDNSIENAAVSRSCYTSNSDQFPIKKEQAESFLAILSTLKNFKISIIA